MCVSIGKGRHQFQRIAKRALGLVVLAAQHEDGSLIAPENGIVLLGADGAVHDLFGEIEVAGLDGLPSLIGQFASAATLLFFLLLGIHTSFL